MKAILPEIKNPLSNGRLIGFNISHEEYSRQLVDRGHPSFRIGRTELHDFSECSHKWLLGFTHEDTESTDWGKLFEAMIGCPIDVGGRFAVCPATYANEKGEVKEWTFAAKVCKQWKEEQADRQIVKLETFKQAQNAAKFFFGNPELKRLVQCSQKQVMVEANYQDEETNLIIPIKTLVDLVPAATHESFGQSLADLKTTRNAKPFSFSRDVFSYWLHVQAALYLDAWNAQGLDQRIEWRLLVSESGPPWESTPYLLSQDYITLGRMTYIDALKRYCRCLVTKQWPGYADPERSEVYDGWALLQPEAWMVSKK